MTSLKKQSTEAAVPRSSDSRVSEVFTTDIDGAKQPDDRLRRSRSAQPTSRMNIENRQADATPKRVSGSAAPNDSVQTILPSRQTAS